MPINNAQKALLHVALKKTGMTEAEYRDLLSSVGVSSSADPAMNRFKLKIIMKRFSDLGFEGRASVRRKSARGNDPKGPLLSKIDALLIDLDYSRKYADGIARRMFNIRFCQWCEPDQLRKIVAALMYHQKAVNREQ